MNRRQTRLSLIGAGIIAVFTIWASVAGAFNDTLGFIERLWGQPQAIVLTSTEVQSRICAVNNGKHTIFLSDNALATVKQDLRASVGDRMSIVAVDGTPVSIRGLTLEQWTKSYCNVGLSTGVISTLNLQDDLSIDVQLDRPVHVFEFRLESTQ